MRSDDIFMNSNYFNKNICLLVIQRGFGTQQIFHTASDYKMYLKLMKHYKQIYHVEIFSFCFFESSIYIVIGARDSKLAAQCLGEINRSFCVFISAADQYGDSLSIQRAKMVVIEDERALYDFVSFVESFPVKRKLVLREQDYEWSSFRLRMMGNKDGLIENLDLCP